MTESGMEQNEVPSARFFRVTATLVVQFFLICLKKN